MSLQMAVPEKLSALNMPLSAASQRRPVLVAALLLLFSQLLFLFSARLLAQRVVLATPSARSLLISVPPPH